MHIRLATTGFHSIGFPSEWGDKDGNKLIRTLADVSIQLVSPVSGENR